jgi:hypothetical protein
MEYRGISICFSKKLIEGRAGGKLLGLNRNEIFPETQDMTAARVAFIDCLSDSGFDSRAL